jgi:UrcA family protein
LCRICVAPSKCTPSLVDAKSHFTDAAGHPAMIHRVLDEIRMSASVQNDECASRGWKNPAFGRKTMDARKVACVAAATFVGTLLIGAAINPAQAQTVSSHPVTVTANADAPTRIVHYGDLSLATRQGQHVLLRRVSDAVSEVCPSFGPESDAYRLGNCKGVAWAGARPQIRRAIDRALSGESFAMSIEITAAGQ